MTLFDEIEKPGIAKIEIDSATVLVDVDRNARVMAGPGAGKTHWLVGHVKRISEVSTRLEGVGKIACISYTNVAVTEILTRLGDSAHSVEADTIHAFLYRSVVRPYARLLKQEDGTPLINHAAIDGHDEHKPSQGIVKEWIKEAMHKDFIPPGTIEYLKKLRWVQATDGSWSLRVIAYSKPPDYFPSTHLSKYKPHYWKRGILDHDDILYLACRILAENPNLAKFLAARYPYIVIDEFQDTSPAQSAVVRWLALAGSTITIIGDLEQSIFSFQGARPSDFVDFSLDNLDDYVIPGNRRSTGPIVSFLNKTRHDGLDQKAIRGIEGEPVRVYVGQLKAHVSKSRQLLGNDGETLACLLRTNEETRELVLPVGSPQGKPWNDLDEIDWDRSFFLERVFRGVSLSSQGKYGTAVREVIKGIRVRDGNFRPPVKGAATDLLRRAAAVVVLERICQDKRALLSKALIEIYSEISLELSQSVGLSLTGVKAGGKFALSAAKLSGLQLLSSLRSSDTSSLVRTIHQAKGAEFNNVIFRIATGSLAESFLTSGGTNLEEQRLCYVAASRARDRLIISVPALGEPIRKVLTANGVEIVDL